MKQHIYVTVVQCLGFMLKSFIYSVALTKKKKKQYSTSSSEVLQIFWSMSFVCHQGHGVSSGSALDVVLNDELQSFAVRISPLTGVQQKCSSVIVRL